MHIVLFKVLELWWRPGSWCRPDEWVFSIDRNCPAGCTMIELGFCGFSILSKGCRRNDTDDEDSEAGEA